MEIPAASLSEKAVLGQGYDTEKEEFVGHCASGAVDYAGNQETRVSFDRSLEQSEMQRELGFEIGAKVRYGLFEGSAAAAFASSSSASDYSDVTIYSHTITFKNAKLRYPGMESGLTPQGKAAKGAAEGPFVGDKWCSTCGHEFVDQITLGAKLLISISVEFATREDKQSFSAEFAFSGPPVEVEASIKQASRKFGKRASLSVQGYQLGGDVRKLSSIFGGNGAGAPIIMASMDNPQAVLDILNAAVQYSSTDFPNQVDPNAELGSPVGPAHLSYITSPWAELGLYSTPGIISDLVKVARRTLSDAFERSAKYQNRLSRILNGPVRLSPRQLEHFQSMQRAVSANLRAIQDAALVAYTDFNLASAKVEETVNQLTDFTAEEFEVLPESFAQWWDMKDLPGTLIRDKQVLNDIAGMYIPKFNDFKEIEDKGLALQRYVQQEVGYLALGAPVEYWVESPVFKLFADAPIKQISVQSGIPTIAPLALLNKAEDVSFVGIGGAEANDLSPFSTMKNLRRLDLGEAPIDSLSALIGLEKLEEFSIRNNSRRLSDVTPLAHLPSLKELIINNSKIQDASSLANSIRLEQVSILAGLLNSIEPFTDLPKLRTLAFGSRDAVVEDTAKLAHHARLSNIMVASPVIQFSEKDGWDSTWTRVRDTNQFDVEFRHRETNEHVDGTALLLQLDLGPLGLMITALSSRGGKDVIYWGQSAAEGLKGNWTTGIWKAGGLTLGQSDTGGEFSAKAA